MRRGSEVDREDFGMLGAIGLVIGALIAIIFLCFVMYSVTFGRAICEGYNSANSLRFRWEWPAGCMVEVRSGYWIPTDKYDWHALQTQPTY